LGSGRDSALDRRGVDNPVFHEVSEDLRERVGNFPRDLAADAAEDVQGCVGQSGEIGEVGLQESIGCPNNDERRGVVT
jgi:hypothetical protein